jgi:hypothetical protein
MFAVFIYLGMESVERYFKYFNLQFSKIVGNFLTILRQQSSPDRNSLYSVRFEVLRLLSRRNVPYGILNIGATRRRVPQNGNINQKKCSALDSRDLFTLADKYY